MMNTRMASQSVSVVVITYNSSKTVIDTLNSIKNQTYPNIELIITDDKSNDNTIKICEDWLKVYGDRFVNYKLLKSEINTGVAGNNNRGMRATTCEWIKTIAGDDMLVPTALDEFVSYIDENPDVRVCMSNLELFSNEGPIPLQVYNDYDYCYNCLSEPYDLQLKRIKRELKLAGPGLFIQRSLFNEIGGFSEEYPLGEEWPFYYKIIKGGNRIYAIDKKLVLYRISTSSLCRSKQGNGLRNPKLFYSGYRFFFDYPFRDLLNEHKYFLAWDYYLSLNAEKIRYDTNNSSISKIWCRMCKFLSPYAYLRELNLVEKF